MCDILGRVLCSSSTWTMRGVVSHVRCPGPRNHPPPRYEASNAATRPTHSLCRSSKASERSETATSTASSPHRCSTADPAVCGSARSFAATAASGTYRPPLSASDAASASPLGSAAEEGSRPLRSSGSTRAPPPPAAPPGSAYSATALAAVWRRRVAAAHCARLEREASRAGETSSRSDSRADARARACSAASSRPACASAATCNSSWAHAAAPSASETSCEEAGSPGEARRLATRARPSTLAASSFSRKPSRPGTKKAPPFSIAAEGRT
mmetsp:Transcript_38766/g.126806  ORF Transcript_38766/g.126806 Transcript_38766/m.126806 type:complete len:270 (+) Transcript_38766:115-924(+)